MLSRPGHIIIGDGALMKCDSAAQLLTDSLRRCTLKNDVQVFCGFLWRYIYIHIMCIYIYIYIYI